LREGNDQTVFRTNSTGLPFDLEITIEACLTMKMNSGIVIYASSQSFRVLVDCQDRLLAHWISGCRVKCCGCHLSCTEHLLATTLANLQIRRCCSNQYSQQQLKSPKNRHFLAEGQDLDHHDHDMCRTMRLSVAQVIDCSGRPSMRSTDHQ